MKSYRIKLPGRISGPFSEHEVEDMFRAGTISVTTLFQRDGSANWRELDEFFPMLKYGINTNWSEKSNPLKNYSPIFWVVGIGSGIIGTCVIIFLLLQTFSAEKPADFNTIANRQPILAETTSVKVPPQRQVLTPPMRRQNAEPPIAKNVPRRQPAPVTEPETLVRQNAPAPAVEVTLAQRRRSKEFQVPIYKRINMANFGGPNNWCKITQESPAAIFIQWWEYQPPVRYEKITGFEGNNYTPICGVNGGTLFFVDSPRATPGLRIFVVD